MVPVILFALFAWAVWPEKNERGVSVAYAGVSPHDSNLVLFTIRNRSKGWVYLTKSAAEERLPLDWFPFDGPISTPLGTLAGRGVTNHSQTVPCTNRWRVRFASVEPLPDTFVVRFRRRLGLMAGAFERTRPGQWLHPKEPWEFTYSPEMLGNHPAPPNPDR